MSFIPLRCSNVSERKHPQVPVALWVRVKSRAVHTCLCAGFRSAKGNSIHKFQLPRGYEWNLMPFTPASALLLGPAKANVHKFQLGDQDVLNYYFHSHPDQLHEVRTSSASISLGRSQVMNVSALGASLFLECRKLPLTI